MAIDDVRADYVAERAVLQSWFDKDIPGSAMSKDYKDGWKNYLTWVMQISDRMIGLCDGKDTGPLIDTLNNEARVYDTLADVADLTGLRELRDILRWEATSRRMIVDSLK